MLKEGFRVRENYAWILDMIGDGIEGILLICRIKLVALKFTESIIEIQQAVVRH